MANLRNQVDMTKTTRACLRCTGSLEGRHGNARYCANCYPLRVKQHEANRAQPRTCPHCAEPFTSKTGREKYCTRRCSGLAARARQLAAKWHAVCVACASPFETADTRMVACSTRCRIYHRRHPGYVDVARTCVVCSDAIPREAHRSFIYCTERCRRLVGKHIRRNRQAGAPAEPVRLADIFERDGWRCHLCGLPVDKGLADHHPMMASLDHVIPVSDPGYPGHVAANLALAHLICNTSKGGRARPEDWDRYRLLSKG